MPPFEAMGPGRQGPGRSRRVASASPWQYSTGVSVPQTTSRRGSLGAATLKSVPGGPVGPRDVAAPDRRGNRCAAHDTPGLGRDGTEAHRLSRLGTEVSDGAPGGAHWCQRPSGCQSSPVFPHRGPAFARWRKGVSTGSGRTRAARTCSVCSRSPHRPERHRKRDLCGRSTRWSCGGATMPP